MGVVYVNLGENHKAIESYKQAIKINPDYALAHHNLGLTYNIIGDRGNALEEYKILMKLDKEMANKLFDEIYK